MRLFTYITVFYVVTTINFCFAGSEHSKRDKITISQSEWVAKNVVPEFKTIFDERVDNFSKITNITFIKAKRKNIECMPKDHLGLLDILCFIKGAKHKPSPDIPFENDLEKWFKENEYQYRKSPDYGKALYRIAVPLITNRDCKVCHGRKYKENLLVGAMTYYVPLKHEDR